MIKIITNPCTKFQYLSNFMIHNVEKYWMQFSMQACSQAYNGVMVFIIEKYFPGL